MEAQSQAVNTTTRAALFRRGGPAADVLFREEIQPVGAGPGGVQVRFAAFGINPTDWKERSSGTTLKDHDVKVPNQDGAGGRSRRWGKASTSRALATASVLRGVEAPVRHGGRAVHAVCRAGCATARRRARGPRGEPWHRGR